MTRFHRFVFHKVLRLEKDPMMFDPDNAESSYIIVPVIHGKSFCHYMYLDINLLMLVISLFLLFKPVINSAVSSFNK